MGTGVEPGSTLPDYELPEHSGRRRKLSELQGHDPLILVLSRGHFCPKDRRQMRNLVELYPEIRVAYTKIVTISTDNLLETNEMRDALGAAWPFLSDPGRVVQKDLDIAEYTDSQHNPMIRTRSCSSRAFASSPPTTVTGLGPAVERRPPPRSARGDSADPSRLGSRRPRPAREVA